MTKSDLDLLREAHNTLEALWDCICTVDLPCHRCKTLDRLEALIAHLEGAK